MKAHNEIRTEFYPRLKRVADRLGRVENCMTTVLENAQRPSNRIGSQKAGNNKAPRISQYNNDESTSIDKHCESSETDYESDNSSSEKEGTRRRHKRKTKKKGSTKQAEDVNLRFKERGPNHSGLKEINPFNNLYRKVLSYRL